MHDAAAGPLTAPERIDDLNRRSAQLVFQHPREALAFSEEALALARAAADQPRMALSALRLGTAASVSGDDERAALLVAEALALFQAVGDTQGEAGAYLSLSTVCRNLGRLIDGLQHALQGLDIARREGLQRLQGACLSNVGLIHTDLGDHQKALEAFLAALPLTRAAGLPGDEAMCLTNLGDVCQQAGEAAQALTHYGAALAIIRRLGHTHHELDVLCGLGQAHVKLGQAEEALSLLRGALDVAQARGDHKCDARLLLGLGDAYQQLGQAEDALHVYRQARTLAAEARAAHEESRALRWLGALHLKRRESAQALDALEEGLALAQGCRAQRDEQEIHALLSETHRQRGAYRAALQHYQRYHQLERELDNLQALHRTQALLLQVDLDQARHAAEAQRQINARLTELNQELAAANAQKAELLARLQAQAEHLVRLSQEDALTGLSNRRHFNECLEAEVQRALRYGRPLSVVLLDIDHFKAVNDTYSHQVGDLVLRELAGLLRASCRQMDTVARFGGEEFVLLLPETAGPAAQTMCERLRQTVQNHDWSGLHPGLRLTVSLGVASYCTLGAAQLLALADAELYRAKGAGRNRVSLASEPGCE
ncbi:tetratricopeptide repeat-containing diguanylate cyclase [Deinococcus multiflagellatus]|uniref:Diguanylate cyclase n=1 Tax=Deinococcus multiflagellatus TaxID=1656887 RepID=A0ABW1ZFD6_9DEIO|nr:tetratricopeptide repeat-containing diguanylate cyclase [Deinococcus multiflagellatus]MBZ9711978.1 diguanylate cyclase [Deinococcus multiflagellatus]